MQNNLGFLRVAIMGRNEPGKKSLPRYSPLHLKAPEAPGRFMGRPEVAVSILQLTRAPAAIGLPRKSAKGVHLFKASNGLAELP